MLFRKLKSRITQLEESSLKSSNLIDSLSYDLRMSNKKIDNLKTVVRDQDRKIIDLRKELFIYKMINGDYGLYSVGEKLEDHLIVINREFDWANNYDGDEVSDLVVRYEVFDTINDVVIYCSTKEDIEKLIKEGSNN